MVLCLLILAFLLIIRADVIEGSFLDDFVTFDTMRWRKVDRSFACVTRQCIYANKESVQHIHLHVQLSIQKNCEGARCCLNDICTSYTGGMMISVRQFTHGSFRFRAQPLLDSNLR